MNIKSSLVVVALGVAGSGAAFADALVSEGYVHSAPPAYGPSQVDRAAVRAEAREQVRVNISDVLAAEGRGAIQSQPGSKLTRTQVRAEAAIAMHEQLHDPIAASGEGGVARAPLHPQHVAANAH